MVSGEWLRDSIHYSLLLTTTHYYSLLLTTAHYYSLLTTHYSPLTTHYSPFTTPHRSQMPTNESKPYRPNVGIALFNRDGLVLIARRFKDDGPEIILPGLEWQMPQGGIDAAEDPRDAVMRELWEETGVTSACYLRSEERRVGREWREH